MGEVNNTDVIERVETLRRAVCADVEGQLHEVVVVDPHNVAADEHVDE